MEAYKLFYLEQAKNDITDIVRYIACTLKNQTAAKHIAGKIHKEIEMLSKNPYVYQLYIALGNLKHEYRKISVENYFIFYYINEEEHSVVISRVVYAKRNISKLLKGMDL